jgi:hypothetical protein
LLLALDGAIGRAGRYVFRWAWLGIVVVTSAACCSRLIAYTWLTLPDVLAILRTQNAADHRVHAGYARG